MKEFEKEKGLDKLLIVLQGYITRPKRERGELRSSILLEILRAITQYMNYKDGMHSVRTNPKCLALLVRLLYEKNYKIVLHVLITLAVVSVSFRLPSNTCPLSFPFRSAYRLRMGDCWSSSHSTPCLRRCRRNIASKDSLSFL
jgi:hypothetical protein